MQLSDYSLARDLRRFALAHRMVTFEARTGTISQWTGLPYSRIRRMHQALLAQPSVALARVRGPSPKDHALFLSSKKLRTETAAAAALCELCGVIPVERGSQVLPRLPTVSRGERLCTAWELFCATVPHRALTFEHLVLLTSTLAGGEKLTLDHCATCDGIIVVDIVSSRRRICSGCCSLPGHIRTTPAPLAVAKAERDTLHGAPMYYQGSLF